MFCLGQASLNIVICCFWYFWYPLIFFLEFSKNLEFSRIFWVPQIFFDFFSKNLEFSQIFLLPPDFFYIIKPRRRQAPGPRRIFFLVEGCSRQKKNPTGSRRLSPPRFIKKSHVKLTWDFFCNFKYCDTKYCDTKYCNTKYCNTKYCDETRQNTKKSLFKF